MDEDLLRWPVIQAKINEEIIRITEKLESKEKRVLLNGKNKGKRGLSKAKAAINDDKVSIGTANFFRLKTRITKTVTPTKNKLCAGLINWGIPRKEGKW